MQYMLLIYEDESGYGDTPEMMAIIDKHMALVGELGDRQVDGAGLQPVTTATTVRTTGGKQVIHDGPFAETREQLGGYYVIEAPDLDAALEIAKKSRYGSTAQSRFAR
ncbi:YciI family protein [Sphingomonas alpina]|uniref:YciI family protein n=1 Tax=Sphingomonas alpina TaxID=653931 RepID=UPI001E4CCE89|nr:YciI family protein [Sphingomonas alpina]